MKQQLLIALLLTITFNLGTQGQEIVIHQNNRVASLQIPTSEYNDWIAKNGIFDGTLSTALIQNIYKRFEDSFDFIFLILNENTKPDGKAYGRSRLVSNNVSGIGKQLFNNANDFGSNGKLKALIELTQIDFLRSGPSLHELMHTWANSAIPTETVDALGTNLTSYANWGHWGFTGGSSKGQLGGFDQSTLVSNGGNSYTVNLFGPNANGANSVPYNELELYLMGMIPVTSVSNFDVFSKITSLAINTDQTRLTFVATKTTYTPESLENLLGARSPASDTYQKDFKALVMILTDEPVSNDKLEFLDDQVEKFSRTSSDDSSSFNFWEATNGLGTIDMSNLDTSVLGLENNVLTKTIAIFPNPANEYIKIQGLNNSESYKIYDALGKEIIKGQTNKNEIINIKNLTRGSTL
tara:strand:- start:617 stop:1846 length:1230 start_codon:yes stop_codon:yes gene_type:complete